MSVSLILSLVLFLPKANCAVVFYISALPTVDFVNVILFFYNVFQFMENFHLIFFHFSLLLYALVFVIFLPLCHALEDLGFNFLLKNQTCAVLFLIVPVLFRKLLFLFFSYIVCSRTIYNVFSHANLSQYLASLQPIVHLF